MKLAYQLTFLLASLWTVGFCQAIQDVHISFREVIQNADDKSLEWVLAIREFNQSQSNHNMELRQYLEKQPALLEQAVQHAYGGNLMNMQNIILFLNHFNDDSSKLVGYRSLLVALKENGHEYTSEMMILIYNIRQAMLSKTIDRNLSIKYEFLKTLMPTSMRKIIFGQTVTIKNRSYSEYIYESEYDNTNGNVMSWRPKTVTDQSYFYFEQVMVDGELYNYMRNDRFVHEAPMCPGGYYDSDRRLVVTCGREVASHWHLWKLKPLGGNYFNIQHYYNIYMYAPSDGFSRDKDRRYIFLWYGFVSYPGDSNWQWLIQ